MTRRSVPIHPAEVGTRAIRPAPRRVKAETAPGYGLPRWLRIGVFATIALVIGIVAANVVVDRLQPPGKVQAGALQVHASMEGFDPNQLTVKVGESVKIQLASMDTSMHSDGGGWHQFAIDELNINWRVGPESSQVFDFTAPTTPGTYNYYCDICCGGKANPSMQGKLTVTA
jgi:cytochrome c oxidase subunit II